MLSDNIKVPPRLDVCQYRDLRMQNYAISYLVMQIEKTALASCND